MMPRLSRPAAREEGLLPLTPDAAGVQGQQSLRIVHLGFGAFARAHTALYTELAELRSQDPSQQWRVVGVTQRSNTVAEQLNPQDGLYSVVDVGPGATGVQLVTCVDEVLSGPDESDAVVALIADPQTRIVCLTITEKGYRLDAAGHGIDCADPEIQADLAGRAPGTAVGQIVRGLQLRHRRDAGPLAVLSCDNLPGNGELTREAVRSFIRALPEDGTEELLAGVQDSVSFPNTMVDRMVPQPTAETVEQAARALGFTDEGAVPGEHFTQWIIEDDFPGGRPQWELAGATFSDQVRQWEDTKLRMLNAGHTLLASLGLCVGAPTINDAVQEEAFARACREMYRLEVLPTLELPQGVDGEAYGEEVLHRFANESLGHTTAKVGSDGSLKIGPRLGETITRCLDRGLTPQWASLAVGAWVHHVLHGREEDVADPLAEQMRRQGLAAEGAESSVSEVLRVAGLFEDLLERDELLRVIVEWVRILRTGDEALRSEIIRRSEERSSADG
ncbi:mannitol dehydrogenase family protein [Nesterenkonia xinjiangensis]|uniref:Fructuronate reductase n=1 Tax=Nesterenkonia xinjiangensis TaxID=225327 RepID=A0A7Z0GKW6_9MICC|nr:mannitol dehydrogenase family protein [Nesterenkonia xinjiangensis]NYJ77319.1 fructuronate reductase [Nesterenkonia xinjiangensis]